MPFHFYPIMYFIFLEKRKLHGFLSNPIVSLAPENAVNNPVAANRCTLITLLYFLFRISRNNFHKFRNLFFFLSQISVSCKKGCPASRLSFPFLTRKSISASGKC